MDTVKFWKGGRGLGLALWMGLLSVALGFDQPDHPQLPNFDKRLPEKAKGRPVPPGAAAAQKRLETLVAGVQVDWDDLSGQPRFIRSVKGFLGGRAGGGQGISQRELQAFPEADRQRVIKAFLNEHSGLFGHGAEALQGARLTRDYSTGRNGLRTVVWEQVVEGIPVFEGLLVGHLTGAGDLVNLCSLLLPEPEKAARLAAQGHGSGKGTPRVSGSRAVALAAEAIEEGMEEAEVRLLSTESGPEHRQRFKAGRLPGEAEGRLVWLPMSGTELRLCWQVELVRPAGGEAYRVLIDAETGEALVRHARTFYLAESVFRVFTGQSPSPLSPGHSAPSTNQPPVVTRELVRLAALSTNASPLGWIAEADNQTLGNNVDAHLDRDADNLPDLPRPQGSPSRVFDYQLDLEEGPASYGEAATVQLFYWCNWAHDRLHELGFTEAAGNLQKDNFGRGGLGGDPLLADAQDGSGVNNANFTPTPDGISPRIQMFVFDGPEPDRDGDLDADVVLHEYAHGLTDRMVGGGAGIYAWQSLGLAEGWSDFYALALLTEPGNDPAAAYPVGGYVTWQYFGLQENYYYGIRRYPYSTDLGKNPLTFKDIDPTQADPHPGVPVSPRYPFNPLDADKVHRQGEVWCSALWEVRAKLMAKYGASEGGRLALELVTDGLRLTPPNPTFLQARDGILQADLVRSGGANNAELWDAFAKRGMGMSASGPPNWTTTGVREAYNGSDGLVVQPMRALLFSGPVGGPVAPLCRELTVTNSTAQSLPWELGGVPSWLYVTPSQGDLSPGTDAKVTVCWSGQASLTGPGNWLAGLLFTNLASGRVTRRDVQLRVTGLAMMPFVEDFEGETLGPYWMLSGTGFRRTQVTTNHEPQGGSRHLTMDSSVAGYESRNELTLALDLEGYTNVMLRFWAKQFNERPDGPPPTPFRDEADFDGVAISQDGVTWYEAEGLRALADVYSGLVVDLNPVVREHGLAYNSAFRIRFNQTGNEPIPASGIALDNLSVTGWAPRRLVVRLPAGLREGDGLLAGAGRVSLPEAPAEDVAVSLSTEGPGEVMVPESVTIRAGTMEALFDLRVGDDGGLDGSQAVGVRAAADGYVGGRAETVVADNESAVLSLSIPASAIEGEGVLVGRGLVRASGAAASAIVVTLVSSDPTEISVPPMVVLPAGQTSVPFNVTVVDDGEIDGPKTVVVRAHVENWVDDIDVIEVADNEQADMELSVPALVSEDAKQLTAGGLVRLSGTLATNLVVSLRSSDTSELTVPTTLVLAAGAREGRFDLVLADEIEADGVQTVMVTAEAPGFPSHQAVLRVHDNESPPAPYDPHPGHLSRDNPVQNNLRWRLGMSELIINGGFETGGLTGWGRESYGGGDFVINDGSLDPPGPEGPAPPLSGQFGVISQPTGPGRRVLYQDLLIPTQVESAVLSWHHRIRNHASEFRTNQAFRVEIRSVRNEPVALAYSTRPGDPPLGEWTEGSWDLTGYRGQRIRVAFVEEDSLGILNVQVDDVRLMVGFPGTTFSEVFFGASPVLGPADFIASTTNTFWPLPELAQGQTFYWQVVSRRGAQRVPGPVWEFSTRGLGPLDHFDWEPMAGSQVLGAWFPVRVTARDDLEQRVTSYGGSIRLRAERAVAMQPVRLLTFVGYSSTLGDYRRPLAAIGAHFTNFVVETTVEEEASALRAQLVGQDVFLVVEQRQAGSDQLAGLGLAWGEVLQDFVRGGGVLAVCSYNGHEHLILRESGLLPLEKLGTERKAELMAVSAHPLLAGLHLPLEADSISKYAPTEDAVLQTVEGGEPVVISRAVGAGRVVLIGTGYRVSRAEMDKLLANAVGLNQPESVAAVEMYPPVSAYFSEGVWEGWVSVHEAWPSVELVAESEGGVEGRSERFQVVATDDLGIEVAGDPPELSVGGEVVYSVRVSQTGPGVASGVVLSNRLPDGLQFLGATGGSGTCSVQNGAVLCGLGSLAAGTSVHVDLRVQARRAGRFTNSFEVWGADPEYYTANNRADTVTRVNLPALHLGDASAVESGRARFSIQLSPASSQVVSCDFATADLSAQEGRDYLGATGRLIFAPGTTNQEVLVEILDDNLSEGFELFSLRLSNPTNALLVDREGVGSVLDDDPLPRLMITDALVSEGDSGTVTQAVFSVSLSTGSGREVRVDYETSAGTAHPLRDFGAVRGSLVFGPGETRREVVVEVYGDALSEADETFSIKLSGAVGVQLERSEATGTIVDDDARRVERFEWAPIGSPQFLNRGFEAIVRALDGADRVVSDFAGSVPLQGFRGAREAAVDKGFAGWEYPVGTYYHDQRVQSIYLAEELGGPGRITALAFFVSAPPSQRLQGFTIRLQHSGMRSYQRAAFEGEGWTVVYEQDELVWETGWKTFRLAQPFLYNGTDSLLVDFSFNNSSFTTDGQARAVPTAEPRSVYFRTDSGFGDPRLWRGGEAPRPSLGHQVPALKFFLDTPVRLTPEVADGFAGGIWTGMVTVAEVAAEVSLRAADEAGHAGVSGPFEVTALEDLRVGLAAEPDPVGIGGQVHYMVEVTNTGPSVAAGVRLTNDLPALTEFLGVTPSQGVCWQEGGRVVCALGSMPAESTVRVELVVQATQPTDLTNRVEVRREGVEDYLENNSAVLVSSVSPPGVAIQGETVVEGDEGTTNAAFRVWLSHATSKTVSVDYEAATVTATNGVDFVSTRGTLVFAPGVTNQLVFVAVWGDVIDEADETFVVKLSNPTNAVIVQGEAVGTILDNDPLPGMTVESGSAVEGNSGYTFFFLPVNLTAPSERWIRVRFFTSNLTAVAGSDYLPQQSMVLFPPQYTTRYIPLALLGDNLNEPDESFSLHFYDPTNVMVLSNQTVVTILDDDGLVGSVDHYEWSVVDSPQVANVPFPIQLTARDAANRAVTNFAGAVAVEGRSGGPDVIAGAGSASWKYPMASGYHDARTQVIYPAQQLGGPGPILGLALEVLEPPAQSLHNWTIRLRHSGSDHYILPTWEGAGWTTVYRNNFEPPSSGWVEFFFSQPFDYDGTNHLMVDFSFDNIHFTLDGLCRASSVSQARAITFQSDSEFGDPRLWSGTVSPIPQAAYTVPTIRLIRGRAIPVRPRFLGNFVEGVWTGPLTVQEPVGTMVLGADDGQGKVGQSDPFEVVWSADLDGDGMDDSWEREQFGGTEVAEGAPGADPDDDGLSNLAEFLAGTDPWDPFSLLLIRSIEVGAGNVRIGLVTVPGRRYQLEKTGSLTDKDWVPIGEVTVGDGGYREVADLGGAAGGTHFYRIRLVR